MLVAFLSLKQNVFYFGSPVVTVDSDTDEEPDCCK